MPVPVWFVIVTFPETTGWGNYTGSREARVIPITTFEGYPSHCFGANYPPKQV